MIAAFDGLREMTMISIAVRMFLAVVCGGIIGIEREYKRRPAGFRTHILICLGAAMTTLTSQYLIFIMHWYTDIARLGAQVVAGIGFIGAGTIIFTRKQRVKGLTTAAGLWAAAIVGLAIGSGFYEGGLFTTALILVAELFFSKLEYRIINHAPEINLYIEYSHRSCLDTIIQLYRDLDLKILHLEITRPHNDDANGACAIFTLRLHKNCDVKEVKQNVNAIKGVELVKIL